MMTENAPRGPVVFAIFYTAAVVLSIAAVMLHERYGDIPFRNWAPFLQAILSAGAIFAAFAVQDRKRQADREDARDALRQTYVAKSRSMEHFVAWLYQAACDGKLTKSMLKRQAQHFKDDIEDLRRLSLEKLQIQDEISTANLFTATCRQIQARMEDEAEKQSFTGVIEAKTLKYWFGQVVRRRQRMLDAFGVSAEPHRLERMPEALALMTSELEQEALDREALHNQRR